MMLSFDERHSYKTHEPQTMQIVAIVTNLKHIVTMRLGVFLLDRKKMPCLCFEFRQSLDNLATSSLSAAWNMFN